MITDIVKSAFSRLGIEIRRKRDEGPLDSTPEFLDIHQRCNPFTMTSLERMVALHDAVRYVIANRIPGDFVECGVWRGGSAMNMAFTLQSLRVEDRDIHLFDTYSGMPEPSDHDVDRHGRNARGKYQQLSQNDGSAWCYASLDEVRSNLMSTGYPEQRIHFVKGKVEDTIPGAAPGKIALLRLDTDWFESTRHEMAHLFPRLVPGGVLLLDDYGHWQGARRAVDEYFAEQRLQPLLFRIDYTGRMMVKGASATV